MGAMKLGCLAAIVLAFCMFAAAQDQSAQPSVTGEHVPNGRRRT
jgi:hypothetical protein